MNADEDEWVTASTKDNSVFWNRKEIRKEIMPDVGGMTLRDALFILENAGLNVKFSGYGRVTDQSLKSGSKIIKGMIVNIILD